MNGRTNSSDVTIQEINYGALIPLEAPTNLVLTPLNARVDITWTDPVDKVASPGGEDVALWDRTVIIRKAGSAPTSPEDGELVYTETTRNQHQYTAYSDTDNVINNTKYYYAVYAVTTMDTISDPIVDHCKPIEGTPEYHSTITESVSAYATATLDNYAVFTDGYTVFNYNNSLTRGSMTGVSLSDGADMTSTANMAFIGGGYYYDRGSMPGNSYYHNYDRVVAYNRSLVQTTVTEPLTIPRSCGVATAFKEYAIFAGGMAGDNSGSLGRDETSQTDCYDESLTKISISNVSNRGDGLSATALSTHVLIGGGNSASVDAYDSSLTKSKITSLRESKHGAAAVTNNNRAAFIGGQLNSASGGTYSGPSYTVDVYDSSLTRSSGANVIDGYMLRSDIWLQSSVRCGSYIILPLIAVKTAGTPCALYQYDLSFSAQPMLIPNVPSNGPNAMVYVGGRTGNYAIMIRENTKTDILEAI